MQTVLITGGGGQDGAYLAEMCAAEGAKVVRTGLTEVDVRLDVADLPAVESLIRESRPDYVFHFAARSIVTHDALIPNHNAISTGALNILESCWRHCRDARIFLPGSALQFRNTGGPIDEETPFCATSPYSVARIHTTYLGRYFRSIGLQCYVGYLFHHDSPRRSMNHLSQKIAQTARRIAAGSGEKLHVGSLSMEKEWNFAGDIVRAIWTLVSQDKISEVVIGSGRTYPLEAWISACFRAVGLRWEQHVVDIADHQPNFRTMVSNPSRMRGLGWQPQVSIELLAEMMVCSPKSSVHDHTSQR